MDLYKNGTQNKENRGFIRFLGCWNRTVEIRTQNGCNKKNERDYRTVGLI